VNKNHYITASASTLALLAASSTTVVAEGFDGFYAGASMSANSGFLGDNSTSPDYDVNSGMSGGLFAGHNWVLGNNLVVGLEFAASIGEISSPDYTMDQVWDVKARAGYSFGKSMVYGFAGMTQSNLSDISGDVDYNSSGVNFGLGIEYMVTDKISIGAELMRRDLHSAGYYENAKIDSASFRATLRF
jgi:outer membrane immunogenic protein